MGLSTLKLPTTKIEIPDSEDFLTIRGLSLTDLTTLVNSKGPEVALVFGKIMSGGSSIDTKDVKVVINDLMPQFPKLVAEVIAIASDEYTPESIIIAGTLPFPVQYAALEAVFLRTFQSESELKKLVESIVKKMAGVTDILTQMRLPLSENGSGASVAM